MKRSFRLSCILLFAGLLVIMFLSSNAEAATNDMYRLYNPNSGEHFYTANTNERDLLKRVGWNDEGIGWYAPTSGDPVYRMYNPNAGDHHYTPHGFERDHLVKVGWRYEGIGWYSDKNKKIPLYRAYNPNAKAGSHNYTVSKAEQNHLIKVGWRNENIAWYGAKRETAPTVNKAELQALYNKVKGTNKGTYTEASWKTFQNTLDNAKNVLANEKATQAQVTNAKETLQKAFDGLEKKIESKKYTIKVAYLNPAQEDIQQATSIQVEQGSSYTATAPTIVGYAMWGETTQTVDNVQADTTISFQYVPDAEDIFSTTIKNKESTITGFKSGQESTAPVIPEYVVREGIAYPVTSVGSWALGNKNLTSVTIPDTVKEIKSYAFANNKLKEIIVPNSLVSIESGVFTGNQLENVALPEGIQTIKNDAFSYNNLVTISIPSSVTAIGDRAFTENKLKSVAIPDGIESIAYASFAHNQLESIDLPIGLVTIGNSAFYNNKLTTVSIPDQVTMIGEDAFASNQLNSIAIPSSLQAIEKGTFTDNKLTNVTIPQNITSIGSWAFGNNLLTDVSIPSSVKSIDYNAFWNNQLTSVTIAIDCQLGSNVFDNGVIVNRE
ncbi:leucine-rich repeat protein [Enterococcus malodoratus]|uniref:DUF5648 domain-containing protein n=1 Tax=Enterococcus malodoratus ATCC 43197 TaxID=1158601 RepID=R2RQY4_9ENTE|nr:leucine-rich repeat protein [Enterococcus malodoratus]EOH82921.1 hypothetical protein UAI_00039 [Enterococcus malodoratus ATCC 43197]EOT63223.1 hypothetical protein I585_04577 [Enterococcus malodoratus ATCC 43197]SPX03975.1 mannosyl-glycoprotein endo-beta-N-acetylglucosaminidase [Enterococcus malodoratus]STD70837.1 mannosyl-glycoprotein endo-beta-N-acetylglucosaminidase [Enterococcus malodoratus]